MPTRNGISEQTTILWGFFQVNLMWAKGISQEAYDPGTQVPQLLGKVPELTER